jgi:asparagine synthase (glutamine-hydrolysing)
MIPPPSEKDDIDVHNRYKQIKSGKSEGLDGNKYYGYEDNLLGKIINNFKLNGIIPEDNNIHFKKGLYQYTMNIQTKVSMAHIDCDWYESVITCLEQIVPHMISGGVIIIDDYYCWSGCRTAVDKYFSDKKYKYKFIKKTKLHIICK